MRQREEEEGGEGAGKGGVTESILAALLYCSRLEVSGLVTQLWISAADSTGHCKFRHSSLKYTLLKIGSQLRMHPCQNRFPNVCAHFLLLSLNQIRTAISYF